MGLQRVRRDWAANTNLISWWHHNKWNTLFKVISLNSMCNFLRKEIGMMWLDKQKFNPGLMRKWRHPFKRKHQRNNQQKQEPSSLYLIHSLSHVQLFATPWTVAHQAPPSMGFSRQEYWSGFPLPSPGDLPNSGIEPGSPTFQADALTSERPGKNVSLGRNNFVPLPWKEARAH